MRSAKRVGRTLGVLLLVQLAGLIVPFVLLMPVATGARDSLANAAASAFQLRLGVLLLFANCAVTIGISITAFPLFRRYSEAMALWLLAASVAMFSLQAADNAHVLSILSLSQRYAEAGGRDAPLQALAAVAGSTRRWTHFTALLAVDCWIFLLYAILYRFTLVPRALAAFGVATVLLHFAGIPLAAFLGYGVVMQLGMPMALGHIALGAWMVARGLVEYRPPRGAEADRVQLAGA